MTLNDIANSARVIYRGALFFNGVCFNVPKTA